MPVYFWFMFYAYLLRSVASKKQTYVGYTDNLKLRLKEHNQGESRHTSRFAPWSLELYAAFDVQERAEKFEKYLKTGSGRAFAKKHLWQPTV